MIKLLVFGGTPVLIVAWLIGLVRAWHGRPALAFWACVLTILLGLFVFSSVFLLPRYSEFWFDGAGEGDGMALLGFIIVGGGIGAVGVVGLILTGILCGIRMNRKDKLEKDSQ